MADELDEDQLDDALGAVVAMTLLTLPLVWAFPDLPFWVFAAVWSLGLLLCRRGLDKERRRSWKA